jgi:hypothetical protein
MARRSSPLSGGISPGGGQEGAPAEIAQQGMTNHVLKIILRHTMLGKMFHDFLGPNEI